MGVAAQAAAGAARAVRGAQPSDEVSLSRRRARSRPGAHRPGGLPGSVGDVTASPHLMRRISPSTYFVVQAITHGSQIEAVTCAIALPALKGEFDGNGNGKPPPVDTSIV